MHRYPPPRQNRGCEYLARWHPALGDTALFPPVAHYPNAPCPATRLKCCACFPGVHCASFLTTPKSQPDTLSNGAHRDRASSVPPWCALRCQEGIARVAIDAARQSWLPRHPMPPGMLLACRGSQVSPSTIPSSRCASWRAIANTLTCLQAAVQIPTILANPCACAAPVASNTLVSRTPRPHDIPLPGNPIPVRVS